MKVSHIYPNLSVNGTRTPPTVYLKAAAEMCSHSCQITSEDFRACLNIPFDLEYRMKCPLNVFGRYPAIHLKWCPYTYEPCALNSLRAGGPHSARQCRGTTAAGGARGPGGPARERWGRQRRPWRRRCSFPAAAVCAAPDASSISSARLLL